MTVTCPKCGREGRVVDTRRHHNLRWRRRECDACACRWSTYESGDNNALRALQSTNKRYRAIIAGVRAALGGGY